MDVRIDHYIQRLEGIGHHFGHDPRSHDHRNLRQEEEEEEEEEEEWRGIGRQEERVRSVGAVPRQPEQGARRHLARRAQNLVINDDAEGDTQEEEEEIVVSEPRHVKRHRHTHRQHDSRETHVKKARVSDASSIEGWTSGVETGRGESSPVREGDADMEESQELEGSDLFGDRAYQDEARFDFDDQQYVVVSYSEASLVNHGHGVDSELAMLFSPRINPVSGQDVPPPSTQATLIASPLPTEKQLHVRPEAPAPPLPPTIPPSSQQTLVVSEERVVQRARVRGVSAQPGPSVPRERRIQGGVAAPDRNVRARIRSVKPEAQVRKGTMEDALIEEDVGVREEQSEEAVEGLLESVAGIEADEDDSSSIGDTSGLPSYQVVEIKSEPSESDDAETHGSLVRGAVREGSDVEGESGSEQGQGKSEDEDDADRIERMASGKLRGLSPPQPRVTRSQTRAQTEVSLRQTRSGNHARAALPGTTSPRPGTKTRMVMDRIREEERPVRKGKRAWIP